ncbi:hypothetical protein TNCV_4517421 [Trichonephila clavipes]|nr:hypothetical protein TNCV_4517421 [Trichonephila clavipes]
MMRNKMQNREKLSVVGDKCRDWHAWEEEEALCKTVQPERGRKRITPALVDGVKTTVDAQSQTSKFGGRSAHAVSRQSGYSYSTV